MALSRTRGSAMSAFANSAVNRALTRAAQKSNARMAFLGFLATSVAACATPPLPQPAGRVVAPLPKEYSCDQQRRLAAEFEALPADSMARQAIQDYGGERRDLRAVHKLPDPPPCPKDPTS